MTSLADQLKNQTKAKPSTTDANTPEATETEARYRPAVKKLSAELPAEEFKWVRVTAAQHDTNATAIVRGLLLLARKDPKILRAAIDQIST